MVRHCRDTWWLGTAGGYSALAEILGGWALLGYSAVGAAGTLGGWALQGCLVVGHCRDAVRLGPQSGSGRRARTTWNLKSNNPTARVGN